MDAKKGDHAGMIKRQEERRTIPERPLASPFRSSEL